MLYYFKELLLFSTMPVYVFQRDACVIETEDSLCIDKGIKVNYSCQNRFSFTSKMWGAV